MHPSLTACLSIAERCADGALSPQIALMEMLLATEDGALLEQALAMLAEARDPARYLGLQQTYQAHREGCAKIAAILRAEPLPTEARSVADSLAFSRQLFDTLVRASEETSVALYSLGSPEILAAASAEIVARLQHHGLLSPGTRMLDVGCGIGRMAVALAPHVRQVEGIDLSSEMVAVARRRCAGLSNVRISACSGADFAGFDARSQELALAVDSFPYVVQAGPALVDAIFAEAARVLVTGGHFVLLNFSYRGDLPRDVRDAAALAERHGFSSQVLGEQPFALWNGAVFVLQRA